MSYTASVSGQAVTTAMRAPINNNMEMDFYRLFDPVKKDATPMEIKDWQVSGIWPKSALNVQLRALTPAFVRYSSRPGIEAFIREIFPVEHRDEMSGTWDLKIYGDEIAERSAVGVPPKEVSFMSQTIGSEMDHFALAGSKWNVNMLSAEGKQDLKMQLEQVTDGVINRIERESLDSAMLRATVYFFGWAEKAYYPKIQVRKFLDLETSMFGCVQKMKNGLEWLTTQVMITQRLWKGGSNRVVMPLASVEYLKNNRPENTDFMLVGNKTGGAKNMLGQVGQFPRILDKEVRVLEPYQTSSDIIDDLLLERNIQIGTYHPQANHYGYQNPEHYTNMDMTVRIYDEETDMY